MSKTDSKVSSASNANLRLIYKGIVEDIYNAREALIFFQTISHHSAKINDCSYGRFFGIVQDYAIKLLIISIYNLFETSKHHEERHRITDLINSIPTSTLLRRTPLLHYLKIVAPNWKAPSDQSELLNSVRNELFKIRPTSKSCKQFKRIETYRSHVVAHRGAAKKVVEIGLKLEDITWCLDWADKFVATVAESFLGLSILKPEIGVLSISDLGATKSCLNRMLEDLHVISSSNPNSLERRKDRRIEKLQDKRR